MILAVSSKSFADDIVVLNKGDLAPFPGLLFSKDKALELRNNDIELNSQKRLNTSYITELAFKDASLIARKTEIDNLLAQNDNLSKSLQSERSWTTWERIGWVSVGMIASGLAFYGLQKVQK